MDNDRKELAEKVNYWGARIVVLSYIGGNILFISLAILSR
jgi:hypothetical protein